MMLAAERDVGLRLVAAPVDQSDDVVFDVPEGPPRIEPGQYRAVFKRHELVSYSGGRTEKLVLTFDVFVNDLERVALRRFYNASRDRHRRLQAGPSSHLRRDLERIAGRRLRPGRGELNPRRILENKILIVAVRDVLVDRLQEPLGPSAYSVVDRLLRVEAGG